MITTHSRLPYSLPSSISLSFSLSPADTLPTRAISSVLPPLVPFLSPALTRSHGEFYIPRVSCWLPSRVGLRFRCSVPFLPSRAAPLPFPSLSHSRPFSSLVLRIPFNSLSTPSLAPFPPCRTVYISRGSFAHHRLEAVLASRESEFLPAAPPFLAFSLRPFRPFVPSIPLSFLVSFGVSRTSDIYVYSRAFRFHSFRRTRISPPSPPPLLLSLPLPSAPSDSARARSRGPFPSLTSLSLPPRQPAHSFFSFFLPRSVSPPGGCALPHPVRRPPVLSAAVRPSVSRGSPSLTPAPAATPSDSILVPLPPVRPRFLALSDARSSRSRLREAQGGKGGSLLQVVPVSDRRRCRVSRNRSPPMPRGGRTVAPVVYYRYYDYYHYFRRDRYFLFLFSSRGIVSILIRGE